MKGPAIEVLYLQETVTHAFVVPGGLLLKVQSGVGSVFSVRYEDILSPVQNAIYLQNGKPGQCDSIICSSASSVVAWPFLSKQAEKTSNQNNPISVFLDSSPASFRDALRKSTDTFMPTNDQIFLETAASRRLSDAKLAKQDNKRHTSRSCRSHPSPVRLLSQASSET